MHSFHCKCLNVSITTHESLETNETRPILDVQTHGPFQRCELTIAQNALVHLTKLTEKLEAARCLNCQLYVYFVDDSAKLYWLNTSLLSNPEDVARLKTSDGFSKTFKIVMLTAYSSFVDFHNRNNNVSTEALDSPRALELHAKLREAVQQETTATEARIRRYTEQQFQLLKEFRAEAEFELHNLVRAVQQVPETNMMADEVASVDVTPGLKLMDGASLDTPPATPDGALPMSIGNSPPIQSGNKTPIKFAPMKGSHSSTNSAEVHDSDFMFDLDGFEDSRSSYQPNQPISDVDESDSEDPAYKRDGTAAVQIARQYGRQASLNIAKSLPISIPDVMSQFRGSDEDDLDEEQEDNVDIAASMQKLAKSVHGDAVFGDLPTRPRFSTQI